jgi:hypothetical protein
MTSNKFDGSNYMTIEALEDITISVSQSGYLYTLDGYTWNGLPSYYDLPLQNGEKCYFKAHFGQGDNIGRFIVDGRFHLKGNCMSLLFGDDAKNKKDLTGYSDCFSFLFTENQGLISVDSDFLPATTLSDNCYKEMFSQCTNLTNAPTLPATTLVFGCYDSMYSWCNSLNYIKALFTTTPGYSYTWNWVYDVASTGTFVKNPDATWDVVGVNGVPEGWTVKFDGEESGGGLLKFTVDGVAYQFEDGMTWKDWCDSSYNTGGFNFYISDAGYAVYTSDYKKYFKTNMKLTALVEAGAYETDEVDWPMPKG